MALASDRATKDASPDQKNVRLTYLDSIRAVAVILVLVQHFGERVSPTLQEFFGENIQLGYMGVLIFFGCSGFVIPVSLERAKSVKKFWIGRFFRLYPLYWASLLAVGIATLLGWYSYGKELSKFDWLANITMGQQLIRHDNALVVYWTLSWELIFYLSISALFVLGVLKYSWTLSVLVNLGLLLGILIIPAFTSHDVITSVFFALAMMYNGTVYYQWTKNKVSNFGLFVSVVLTAGTGTILLYDAMGTHPDLTGAGTNDFATMTTAMISAVIVFGALVVLGHKGIGLTHNRALAWIGKTSYSIYLMHAIVLIYFPLSDNFGPVTTVAIWTTLTLTVSAATYLVIEKPGIELGKLFTRRQSVSTHSRA